MNVVISDFLEIVLKVSSVTKDKKRKDRQNLAALCFQMYPQCST